MASEIFGDEVFMTGWRIYTESVMDSTSSWKRQKHEEQLDKTIRL